MPARFSGLPEELHTSLIRRSATFFLVALKTTGYYVLPVCSTSHGSGYYVVIRQMLRSKALPAILTSITIPEVYILTGKADRVLVKPDKLEKSHHRRETKGNSGGANFPIVGFQDFHLFKNHQNDGSFPGNYSKRLISCI